MPDETAAKAASNIMKKAAGEDAGGLVLKTGADQIA
jgi:hypothetical protein